MRTAGTSTPNSFIDYQQPSTSGALVGPSTSVQSLANNNIKDHRMVIEVLSSIKPKN